MYRIFLTAKAEKEYKKLPSRVAQDVSRLFGGEFSDNPLSKTLDINKLRVPFLGYRLRIGSYRILFVIEGKTITVYSIKHRKDAYK
ncbi:MAG: hypothetical protein A2836_01725 [Candidatus Taylorbacteria bacterium RIFCSPHIGHO2_01_FULL_45_63]|uniref:Plasmid stabilization protein n=1 Tax=Candidatus Taylorbacteria bacterium RIFCSPHIGHO2_02_FULL_45_35 TaxID=1802311 RepID=A0A1G2MS31_9BACT|nr:MAG: hypothetical protein A2836_01725 [Candidatus Taylorbacteria bacterium RIFCSPHIGHO2_01_FULL_45_63]OHA26676.1 MAG: hypothetical protein A3D56_02630 [Candidatus Taylorbacteria bacterium RIFCSPHIGHO2_02_FULL_45_35]OHA32589.1 MAG: hypothetical protein A3A22_01940 [Candidatus Taylorbacteria bacterium RIFCSPLOWO2_01_FULL_45_34b]